MLRFASLCMLVLWVVGCIPPDVHQPNAVPVATEVVSPAPSTPPADAAEPAQPERVAPDADADDDGDGIANAKDRIRKGNETVDCRAYPEDADGVDDEDGCPDVLPIRACQIKLAGAVVFEFNKAVLRPIAFPVLDDLVTTLSSYPMLKVEVRNHADSQNERFIRTNPTRRRAKAVRKYLITKGIAAERIVAKGFGMDMPIAPNDTSAGRAANRRTEIFVTDCDPKAKPGWSRL